MAKRLEYNPMDNQQLDYAAVALAYMKNPEQSLVKIANILADEQEAVRKRSKYGILYKNGKNTPFREGYKNALREYIRKRWKN